MKTTVKNVKRRQGTVVEAPAPAPPPSPDAGSTPVAGADAAVVADPAGFRLRLVHKFLRNPVLAVEVQSSSPQELAGASRRGGLVSHMTRQRSHTRPPLRTCVVQTGTVPSLDSHPRLRRSSRCLSREGRSWWGRQGCAVPQVRARACVAVRLRRARGGGGSGWLAAAPSDHGSTRHVCTSHATVHLPRPRVCQE